MGVKKDAKVFMEEGVGSLKDLSDIDMSKLQYTSDILERMKKEGMYTELVKTISAMAFADKSKSFMVKILKQRFPTYCGQLNQATFNKWLIYYQEVAQAYTFNRELCLGQLAYLGMKKAEKSVDSQRDDFIVKLMDRLDDGTLSHKNSPKVVESQASSGVSMQTESTLNRIFSEASRFGGLREIEVEDSDMEDGDFDEDEV